MNEPARARDALRALHEQGRIASPWLAGMLARRQTGPCSGSYRYSDLVVREGRVYADGVPDPDDPATLGCLLALVREAYGDPRICTRYVGTLQAGTSPDSCWTPGPWEVVSTSRHTPWVLAEGDTETEVLVAALEDLASDP